MKEGKNLRKFMFISPDGLTFSRENLVEPDVDNFQVVGYERGFDHDDAFIRFIRKNPWLKYTGFKEIICIEVKEFPSEGKPM